MYLLTPCTTEHILRRSKSDIGVDSDQELEKFEKNLLDRKD